MRARVEHAIVRVLRTWIVVIGFAGASGCGASPGDRPNQAEFAASRVQVSVTEVRAGDISQSIELVGNFLPRKRTVIVTEVDGLIKSIAHAKQKFEVEVDGQRYVEHLSLDLGERVTKGSTLLQIDPVEYELSLASAKAALVEADMALTALRAWRRPEEIQRLRAVHKEAEARLSLAESELKRTTSLRAKKLVTGSAYEQRESERDVAKARLDAAAADLLVATNGPTQPEIDLAESRVALAQAEVDIRQDELSRTTIKAPYDGVITDRYVSVGERVTALPRVEIMEMMDLSFVVVQVGIPERLIHQVSLKDRVAVKAEGTVGSVPGIVVLLNEKIDRDSRTYRDRIAVNNRERRFKAGQFVRVSFVFRSSSSHVLVPRQAVTYAGGQPQVFVLTGEKVSLRNVRLGLSDGKQVEILEGLVPNETVVVDDPAILSDAMPVQLREGTEMPTAGSPR